MLESLGVRKQHEMRLNELKKMEMKELRKSNDKKVKRDSFSDDNQKLGLPKQIMESLIYCMRFDYMAQINRQDPQKFMKILYYTEAELFKHKMKMYPKCNNNLGEGYSQYFDEETRLGILSRVKKQCHKILGVHATQYDFDQALDIISKSEKLLKFNYRLRKKPELSESSSEDSDLELTAREKFEKQKKAEELAKQQAAVRAKFGYSKQKQEQINKIEEEKRKKDEETARKLAERRPSDDFKHHPKLQGIHKVIKKLMVSNDKERIQKEALKKQYEVQQKALAKLVKKQEKQKKM